VPDARPGSQGCTQEQNRRDGVNADLVTRVVQVRRERAVPGANASLKTLLSEDKPQTVLLHHLNLQANAARRASTESTVRRPERLQLTKRVASQG
jgi:hypothetical protein